MSRTERLLALIQVLRRYRRPITGRELAREMSVSLRTIYRDLQTLIRQGAPIVKARHKTFYGTTELYVREPGGNIVGFAQTQ